MHLRCRQATIGMVQKGARARDNRLGQSDETNCDFAEIAAERRATRLFVDE